MENETLWFYVHVVADDGRQIQTLHRESVDSHTSTSLDQWFELKLWPNQRMNKYLLCLFRFQIQEVSTGGRFQVSVVPLP